MAKKRKYTKITVETDEGVIRRTVAYTSLDELVEKKKKIEEKIKSTKSHNFETIANKWFDEHREQVQYYTAAGYVAPLKNLIEYFGNYKITEITSAEFQAFLNDMVKKGYAKQTIKLRKIVMSQIFDYAMLQGITNANITMPCKIPSSAPSKKRTMPTEDDVRKINELSTTLIEKYYKLVLNTGLRREEALALKYEDFNYETKTIHVSKVIIFVDGVMPVIRKSTKSQAGNRTIPILPPIYDLFERSKSGYIFVSKNGTLLTKGTFDSLSRTYRRKNQINCTSHQLRHYFATICYDAGLDEKDTQEILGHESIELTRNIYTHIREERREKNFSKLEEYTKTNYD